MNPLQIEHQFSSGVLAYDRSEDIDFDECLIAGHLHAGTNNGVEYEITIAG